MRFLLKKLANRAIKKLNKKAYRIMLSGRLYNKIYFSSYTLNLKCITSPSFTIYSLPSMRSLPASRQAASEPYVI